MRSSMQLTRLQSVISEEQWQNIETFITHLQTSVDGSLADVDFSPLITAVREGWSDRTLTAEEIDAILAEVVEIYSALGITPQEARTLFYDLQTIAQALRLPRTDDNLTGTAEADVLYGGLGNDTLTGADAATAGVGEVDWLIGGGGSDGFVLGDAREAFYNDRNAATAGANDYAIIVDYNPAQDVIQLHGSANQYALGTVPTTVGLTGTAIFYQPTDQRSTPELVGIVAGVTLADFNTGFAFV